MEGEVSLEEFAKMMCQRVCTTSSKDKSVGKISPSGPDWVDDTNVTQCKSCGFVFSFIIRKHHCRMCGHVFCRYCAAETWPLPKFEYLSPVRVCRKCARLCWKAEALVQAIQANDVNSLIKYVQRKNDCNLHIAVFPPLTVAAGVLHTLPQVMSSASAALFVCPLRLLAPATDFCDSSRRAVLHNRMQVACNMRHIRDYCRRRTRGKHTCQSVFCAAAGYTP